MDLQQMMAMLGRQGAGGRPAPVAAPQTTSLASLKAGRMTSVGPNAAGQFTIKAEKKRGTLSFSRTNAGNPSGEGILSLQWSERNSKDVKEDMIVFGDAVFRKVDTKRPEDRVYVLQYTG